MSSKLFKFLFVGIFSVLLIHTSCNDAEEPEPEVPMASFTYEVEELKVTFTNTSTNATSYSWDFGDSNSSTGKDPVHTYASRGTYDVVLTVFNESLTNEQSMTIEVTEPEIRAIILNEGNFGAGNGSISYYYEESQRIANDTVKLANNDSEIGSLVQSIFLYDTVGYVVCNSSDKVEFIHNETFKYLANPITNISQPRYMSASGDKGYISCWGPWASDFTLPDSYVAVVDLNTREVIDSLESGSGPEGILVSDDKLFIANSFEDSMTVVDLNNDASSKIATASAPKQFAVDASELLWASTNNGLQSFDMQTLEPVDTIDIINMNGKMAIDADGKKIYYLTSEPWPGTNTTVFVFDTETKSSSASALITGENFYGIGFNPASNLIYVGDSKAFAGPGQINIYDTDGTLVDTQVTGVGPNGFAF